MSEQERQPTSVRDAVMMLTQDVIPARLQTLFEKEKDHFIIAVEEQIKRVLEFDSDQLIDYAERTKKALESWIKTAWNRIDYAYYEKVRESQGHEPLSFSKYFGETMSAATRYNFSELRKQGWFPGDEVSIKDDIWKQLKETAAATYHGKMKSGRIAQINGQGRVIIEGFEKKFLPTDLTKKEQ